MFISKQSRRQESDYRGDLILGSSNEGILSAPLSNFSLSIRLLMWDCFEKTDNEIGSLG